MSKTTLRHLIISTLALLLSLGVLVYAVYRINNEGTRLRDQVTVLQKEQAHQNSYFKLQKVAEDSKANREALKNHFLKESSDSINFLNEIETLAPAMGVNLKTESLDEITDKKTGAKSIDVKFTFSGSRNAVETFISTLEHIPYLSQVTSVAVTTRAEGDVEAKLAMKVFIISYAE